MVRYIVVTDNYLDDFEKRVNQHLRDGWSIVSNFSVVALPYFNEREGYSDTTFSYYQPMIMYSTDDE